MALAANKNDKYENEAVTLKEGNDLAKEINAIFKSTSALLSHGIDDLFNAIGQKFISPDLYLSEPTMNSKEVNFRKAVKLIKKLKKEKNKEKKKMLLKYFFNFKFYNI